MKTKQSKSQGQLSNYLKSKQTSVMKISRTSQIVATLILGLGPVTAHSQSYFYSGPVSGYTEVDLTPYGVGNGGFSATFGTLTETLYYDPVTLTLEESGSVTISPSSGSFNIYGSSIDPGDIGSATLTIGNNGSFSFDRTTQFYTFGGESSGGLLVPVSGSGIYNGQAFSGSWNIDLNLYTQIIAVTQTSLTFSEGGFPNFSGVNATQGSYVIPGTNLKDAISDGTYYWSWELDSAVAMAVPEPNSPALLGFGLSALTLLRPRLRLRLLWDSVEWQGCNKEKG